MSGRFGATNLFPGVCIVTLIDYDHTPVLRSSLADMALEKGGISAVDSYAAPDLLKQARMKRR